MKSILNYLKNYFIGADKRMMVICCLLATTGIFFNYHYELNRKINATPRHIQYLAWFLVFSMAFVIPYLIYSFLKKANLFTKSRFLIVVFAAPAVFAWKMGFNFNIPFTHSTELNTFYNQVIYWPLKLLIISVILFIIWKKYEPKQPFYGTLPSNFKAAPYLVMLCIMVPLIGAASTQADFLHVYPKLKNLHYLSAGQGNWFYKLIYELAYGSDFITIELFFRGFLILGFIQYAGKEAILPMAVFYCSIHFGKPLAECISSFFGGIILGVISYNTRTIWGGIIVHLGIAWLMELGGYLGNLYY
jgi:membrane protease YdiL (CAAX protease family)